MSNSIRTLLKGVAIGIGNIIPGVSGGTIAVVLGIYETLLESISFVLSKDTLFATVQTFLGHQGPHVDTMLTLKRHLLFIGRILLGAAIGVFLFSHILSLSLEQYPRPTLFFFMGLIIGSLPAVCRAHKSFSLSMTHLVAGSFGFFLMVILSFFPESHEMHSAVSGPMTYDAFLYLAGSGAIAAGTMVIPGISGSLMLLIIGSYYTILNAVSQFNIPILFVVGLGAIVGIIVFTKLINFLLKRYPVFSAYFIIGLVVGSLIKLWPGFTFDAVSYIGLGMGVLGIYCGKKLG